MNYLQISTISPPIGQGASPEQRIKFAKEFEKLFQKKGMEATVTTSGDQQRIVTISGKIVNGPVARAMTDNVDAISDLREMGFKTLVMTDGKVAWNIDLKN